MWSSIFYSTWCQFYSFFVIFLTIVGTIGLVDYDVVDLSNLQRQVLHTEEKVDVPKVDSAFDFLKRLSLIIVPSRYYVVLLDISKNSYTSVKRSRCYWLVAKKNVQFLVTVDHLFKCMLYFLNSLYTWNRNKWYFDNTIILI